MKYKIIFGIILILTVSAIGYLNLNKEKQITTVNEEQKTITEDGVSGEEKKMPENKPSSSLPEEAVMEKEAAGTYKDYSTSSLAEATKNDGKAVLFFWAAWCPYCKTANAEFLANLDKIPSNVTVLKTNYDTERELKIKYGITYQHTFVQVDAQGNQIAKWNGGGIQELLNNLK